MEFKQSQQRADNVIAVDFKKMKPFYIEEFNELERLFERRICDYIQITGKEISTYSVPRKGLNKD